MPDGTAIGVTATLETITCCKCGILFAVQAYWRTKRIEDQASFYCPNGHPQNYCGETKADRYKRLYEREQENVRLERVALYAERRKKERAERKLKRIDKGVCHKCNRHFRNVARHMKTKHGKREKGSR